MNPMARFSTVVNRQPRELDVDQEMPLLWAEDNFDGYSILRMTEMPQVEVHIVPSQARPGGVGEKGAPALAPAVANAVFAATGTRLRALPLRLS
jgi:CO/xanthine dehydrogenase Mo-binding subunit